MLGACGDLRLWFSLHRCRMVMVDVISDLNRTRCDSVVAVPAAGGGSRLEILAHNNLTYVWIQSVLLSSKATDTEPKARSFLIGNKLISLRVHCDHG
ncbi:unnamed protein product [Ectocarpus sp. 12 AP-2014]